MRSLTTALFCMVFSAPVAGAGPLDAVICDDRARLENQISSRTGATKLAQGMRGPDAIVEVWVVPATGDWTMVQTYANGTSCILAMGEAWDSVKAAADPDAS